MRSVSSRCLVVSLALAAALGCDGEGDGADAGADAGELPVDAGPPPLRERTCHPDDMPPLDPEPEGPLEVGFGRASLAWRVGAKPGQVGTLALPERDALLGRGAGEIFPITRREPERMLPMLTDWARGWLDEQLAAVEPGTYNFVYEPSEGLELPPDVRAVVVRRGHREVALVRADLFIMHEQLQRRVAALIEPETGIGRDGLFLVATHNHSVAHALSPAPGVWTRADSFDPRHFVYASHRIAEAIRQAHRDLAPAELRIEARRFGDVQHNIIGPRRVSLSPGDGAPTEEIDVGYPYDYFDDRLLVLRFDAPGGGGPRGLVFVLGVHPECLPEGHGLLTGEWPLHVEAALHERAGVEAMWLPGPLGDVEPDRGRVNEDHLFFRGGFEAMHEMADLVTDAVHEAFEAAGEAPGDAEPALAQLACEVPGPVDYPMPDLAELGARLPMVRVVQDTASPRVHLFRLGDAMLVGLPAEITTDLSLNLRTRLDDEPGNVHQGFVWPDAPAWVQERIERNFQTDELDPAEGVRYPMVVSLANGYFGYVVSHWEYENRDHYRQSMTFFGPGTADHLATASVAMARELAGGPLALFTEHAWHELDREGAAEIEAWLATLEPAVADLSRRIPASDEARVGTLLSGPTLGDDGVIRTTWAGASNDLEPPTLWLERLEGEAWEPYRRGPGRRFVLYFEAPDVWRAEWQPEPGELEGAALRLRVEGRYRGATPGVSEPEPHFDPDGADRDYEVITEPFPT